MELFTNDEGYENSCGRPGINGMYESDATKKFGVNCYGVLPSAQGVNAQLTILHLRFLHLNLNKILIL